MDFKQDLYRFEKEVIVKGVFEKKLPMFSKKAAVSVKDCRLHKTPFGEDIGWLIDTDLILTIDYYGHLKKSRGFYDYYSCKNLIEKQQIKLIESAVVFFASIRIEDVAAVTNEVGIIAGFPFIKNEILIRRGFRKRVIV